MRQIYSVLPDFWDGPWELPCWRNITLHLVPGDFYPYNKSNQSELIQHRTHPKQNPSITEPIKSLTRSSQDILPVYWYHSYWETLPLTFIIFGGKHTLVHHQCTSTYCSINCLLSIVFSNLEVFFILKLSNAGFGFSLKTRTTPAGNDIITFPVIFTIHLKIKSRCPFISLYEGICNFA